MTTTTETPSLWRVDWYHRSGGSAPYQIVGPAKRKEAIKLAKEKSRLGDFPETWSFKLSLMPEKVKKKKKKELAV